MLTIAVSKPHIKCLPIRKTTSHLHVVVEEFVFASRSSSLLDGSTQLEVFHARNFGHGRIGRPIDTHGKLSMWTGGMEDRSFEC